MVGSVDPNREYDPPAEFHQEAKTDAEELGRQIAAKGWRLLVYSPDARFIEADVVRGFVKCRKALPRSILVVHPFGWSKMDAFPVFEGNQQLFDLRQDANHDWEISFYRSLAEIDGLILIGGGQSTLITGIISITYQIPSIALAKYGGKAQQIWRTLKSEHRLATDDQLNAMAQGGSEAIVRSWIDGLDAQIRNREKVRRVQKSHVPYALTLFLLLSWIFILALGIYYEPSQTSPIGSEVDHATTVQQAGTQTKQTSFVFLCFLFLGPVLAGASGATIRLLVERSNETAVQDSILGAAAGGISGLLYVVAQLTTNSHPYNAIVLTFTIGIGFIAGLTARRVFKQLEGVELLKNRAVSDELGAKGPSK